MLHYYTKHKYRVSKHDKHMLKELSFSFNSDIGKKAINIIKNVSLTGSRKFAPGKVPLRNFPPEKSPDIIKERALDSNIFCAE